VSTKILAVLLADIAFSAAIITVVGFAKYWETVVSDQWATVLLIVMGFDILSGTILACIKGTWNLTKLGFGLLKKLQSLLAIGFFFAVQRMYPEAPQLGHWAIGVFILFVEGKSIIQNVAKSGVAMPAELPTVLDRIARRLAGNLDLLDDNVVVTAKYQDRRDHLVEDAKAEAKQESGILAKKKVVEAYRAGRKGEPLPPPGTDSFNVLNDEENGNE
jgi:toxin secretion/phage lysis holin